MSKEKSEDEIRNEFLSHVRHLVKYWGNLKDKNCEEKLSGLAFSILSAIDGSSVNLCGFILAPCPHEDDKQYHIDKGDDYYPQNHESNVKCDIAGSLHELFYEKI